MELTGAHRILCISIIIVFISSTGVGAVTLELSTTLLKSSGDPVIVSWNELESPNAFDWLGIYSPPESADNHYIGYILLSSVSGWETGKGSHMLPAGKSAQVNLLFHMHLLVFVLGLCGCPWRPDVICYFLVE